MAPTYLAVDLGAESGRVMAVTLDGEKIQLHEVHRFGNRPLELPTGLHWDLAALWQGVVEGLSHAGAWARHTGAELRSVGVDAWGVDWALLTRDGELCGWPHAYRDPRNIDACRQALQRISVDTIYRTTGIQVMPINSLFSLYAQQRHSPATLAAADQLLFIPDLFHYWLSGEKAVEATIASTSQMIDVSTGRWSTSLLDDLGVPHHFLRPTVPPGTRLGPIRPNLAHDCGLPPELAVVTPGSHDTASAVVAVPAETNSRWAFLSSGTWSLLGAERAVPCTSSHAQQHMFTNELGVGGRYRFLKNIAGLWLVQELRRDLQQRGMDLDYAQLTALAAEAETGGRQLDCRDPQLQTSGNMIAKINASLQASGGKPTEDPGILARCCLESLAEAYRKTLQQLESITGETFDRLHLVGGGGRNQLLCQLTAKAIGRPVIVGPMEATALGNALVQALADGRISDLDELRRLVRAIN